MALTTIFCKGKPFTPPTVAGATFTLADGDHDIWSGAVDDTLVASLTAAGAPFYTQAELDRFAMDLTVAASADAAVGTTTTTANGTPTEANVKLELQARLFAAQVRSAIPLKRGGKFNPYL